MIWEQKHFEYLRFVGIPGLIIPTFSPATSPDPTASYSEKPETLMRYEKPPALIGEKTTNSELLLVSSLTGNYLHKLI